MSKYVNTEVTVNIDAISSRIEQAISDEGVLTQVHQEFANIIDPYVPYDTGALSQNIEVTAEGVRYTEDYAYKQYHGEEFRHKTEHHPLATAYWDKVAMQTEKERLAQTVKEIIVRRLNNG